MEYFAKIVNGLKPLITFAKRYISDAWQDFEYAFAFLYQPSWSSNFWVKKMIEITIFIFKTLFRVYL